MFRQDGPVKSHCGRSCIAGHIPTFAIDPKGDIGNLAFKSVNFDFSKWSGKEADALLKIGRAKYAASLQKTYSDKAAEFEVAPSAAANFAKEVTMRIFTPKSVAGLAVGISPDLSAPQDFSRLLSADIASAADLLDLTSFNLLRLAGYGEGDRKEITFISAILENAWENGENLTVNDLIRNIEKPSFSTIGSLPVPKVVSDRERKDLATRINLLISEPQAEVVVVGRVNQFFRALWRLLDQHTGLAQHPVRAGKAPVCRADLPT